MLECAPDPDAHHLGAIPCRSAHFGKRVNAFGVSVRDRFDGIRVERLPDGHCLGVTKALWRFACGADRNPHVPAGAILESYRREYSDALTVLSRARHVLLVYRPRTKQQEN